ncbi:MAG TPA: pantoate--beta-alanine ligase [Mizugakiibacter sp.]|nr:pantoate--beta-alanine ligase [Mizugakiibacter sp.]
MQTVQEAATLRAMIRSWREQRQSLAFVPTMGNLHEGHFSLLRRAHNCADRVVVSIFVNPTQFDSGEDLAHYPRTFEADQVGLSERDCDVLFFPAIETMYPYGLEQTVRVRVPGLGDTLEGVYRVGHFDGVSTVVSKLFNLVQPDYAVFGEKDWQQLQIVRHLVDDLSLPIEVVAGPTQREPDGLALSSRNRFLNAQQRAIAPAMYATLCWMRDNYTSGHTRTVVETAARARLQRVGFELDYIVIRRATDLTEPEKYIHTGLIGLAAGHLGSTRLIDNILFDV